MSHVRSRRFGVPACAALVAAVLLAGAACAPEDSGTTGTKGSTTSTAKAKATAGSKGDAKGSNARACEPDQLATKSKGTLTVATDQPVYEPWFVDDKPQNGKGFEAAVAYAVASKLGYAKGQVTWARVPFNAAIQPGPKAYDFDINEFSITDERKKAVDFSTSYYDVTQAVIALKSAKIAHAKSIADLKSANLGAQVNTTSYDAISDVIKPTTQPQVFPNNTNAKQALQNGTVDGLVVDLPTAFYMTGAELEGSTIVGQIPNGSSKPEQFGLVLDKGSSLTSCVSQAVDALRKDGTLDTLATKWLAGESGAPKLK